MIAGGRGLVTGPVIVGSLLMSDNDDGDWMPAVAFVEGLLMCLNGQ